ncbi:MAG: gliding motility-associated C-terminal domain-containing protein [Cryomorphaceae bacterium]
MKQLLAALFFFTAIVSAQATHNRAGEITYRHVGGLTYEITIKTYTKDSAPADRPWLPIFWGDGTPQDSIQRAVETILPNDAKENIYIKQHTYPGPGEYKLCVVDPNRNENVLNISNSVLQLFSINTVLRISGVQAPNNSVFFTNRPLQDACLNEPWVFNPGAVDTDPNDNLVFTLVESEGADCAPFEEGVYRFPDEINQPGSPFPNPANQISIDPETGTITWDSPQRQGEYNIAFRVDEFRNGVFMGSVLRDMQITVLTCDNQSPELGAVPDTCVEAGTSIAFNITATDSDGDNVAISGFGLPFQVEESPATLSQPTTATPTTATFAWNTRCSHVRLAPYQLNFEALDNGDGVSLVDIVSSEITVVAPAPENLEAEATGAGIFLSWEPSFCSQATGYKIYRRINPFGFEPGPCETGVPEYTGYVEIASIEGLDNTDYIDLDEVIFGREMCYMVVACFSDGAESYASNEACAEIRFEIPIMKKNSIGLTDATGIDTVAWRSPVELDLEVFPGPYKYILLRSEGYGEADQVVFETAFDDDLEALPTEFISQGASALNTVDSAHSYRVELYSGDDFAGRANLASSLFIELIPNDNELEVTWREETPWINFEYDIYRKGPGEEEFALIATIDTLGYTDAPLVNNREYCYYIVSRGSYFAVGASDTLVNYSQERCGMPYDRTPPCPPELSAVDDCEALTLDLSWTNPNVECEETDDTMLYRLYFAEGEDEPFELIAEFEGATSLDFSFSDTLSIAGCYAVTALDSLAPWPDGSLNRNESEFSNIMCIDNCPEYTLPNVFTPNGDGRNDLFIPFPYRSVESIELTIFNRWGSIVFETTDPDILWDGTNKDSGELVSASTYFYTCRVFTIRLGGIVTLDLAGNVTVFSENVRRTD